MNARPDDQALPDEVADAAILAYDEGVNALLGNPPGTVLGPASRATLLRNPTTQGVPKP